MDGALYVSGSHLSGLAASLDVIGSNLANANTAGFKRTVGRFQQALLSATGQPVGPTRVASPVLPQFDTRPIDFTQGPISTTGRPLDLAIQGDGFFVLETPVGARYTRKGRMYVNAAGELTDAAGNRYAAQGGSLRIPRGARNIVVSRSAEVTADGQTVGRLRLVDIPQPERLASVSWSTFRYDGAEPQASVGGEVIQGAVEKSNVNPMIEMVALTQAVRAYEASTRVMKRMDRLNGELVQAAA